jgi:ABC-type nitrate/sulfonate/bicarbonate transport system permease component
LIYQAELDGIKNINKTLLEVLKLDCDKCSFPAVKMVFLPLSMPFFRTSLLQSAGLGIKVLVVAEFIAQTNHSIGRELYFNRINLEYSRVFAWTIILIIIVTGIEYLVNKYLKLHAN